MSSLGTFYCTTCFHRLRDDDDDLLEDLQAMLDACGDAVLNEKKAKKGPTFDTCWLWTTRGVVSKSGKYVSQCKNYVN